MEFDIRVPFYLLLAATIIPVLIKITGLDKRIPFHRIAWGLAIFPIAVFGLFAAQTNAINDGAKLTWIYEWLPVANLSLGFYLDGLGLLFALIVTGIGGLIVFYTGDYFRGDASAWRFLTYLFMFMIAMLGTVTAGDIVTLFIFWEGTSVLSFLLVAYKYKNPAARDGATKAFLITGAGGIALLVGLLMIAHVAGSTQISEILKNGEAIRASSLYPGIVILIALGALTKSAQFPFHFWLPGAMQAPTPASAYLHSATMVKAGIFILARLNPVLGGTFFWFALFTTVGAITMLLGAFLGLRQRDLKALLAYSTISQLGALVMLAGQITEIAYKALIIGILAHALYKSSLFMIAGIVDHELHTRNLDELGGLRKRMPIAFGTATLAALSMAGFPPMFGFLKKETLLATAVHPSIPEAFTWQVPIASIIAGAMVLAQAGILVKGTFLGKPKKSHQDAHDSPLSMVFAPAIPALISLALGLLPEPLFLAKMLAKAASSAYGSDVKVSLLLWTGFNLPLLLSVVAISLGFLLLWKMEDVQNFVKLLTPRAILEKGYENLIQLIDLAAMWATRLQMGRLRTYLSINLIALVALIWLFGGISIPETMPQFIPTTMLQALENILKGLAMIIILASAFGTIFLKRDFHAVLALALSGIGIALIMVLEPAPDVALVQIVVDFLAILILVLALSRIPRSQRLLAAEFTYAQKLGGLLRDGVVALVAGGVVGLLVWNALATRPRVSEITPFYEANAKILTGAKDIVGAIIVDFRAVDTLIEITVFGLAGLGIYILLVYSARKHQDEGQQLIEEPVRKSRLLTLGIGGLPTSPFLSVLATVALPLSMVIGVIHILYGHDRPGDGFTAGVIIGLGVGFWFMVFGFYETRRRLFWLRSAPLLASGVLLVIVSGVSAWLINGTFLGNVDYGSLLGLKLPDGFAFSSSFIFELAICLTVLGSVSFMINTLGHPGYRDQESERMLPKEEIT